MVAYAAGTWGISGPAFLGLFWAAALAVAAVTAGKVWPAGRSADQPPPAPLAPAQVAYLAGGRRRTVEATLATLHHRGLVGASAGRLAPVTDATSVAGGGLDATVYQAIRHRIAAPGLPSDPVVASHAAQVREELEQLGLRPDHRVRRAGRMGFGLLLGLAAVGVARLFAGLAADRPVGFLVASLVVVVVGAGGLLAFAHRPRTRRGDRALRDARSRYRHLDPAQAPAWRTYGPEGAAMGVALFGTAALWSMDTGLAKAVATPPATGTGSTGDGAGGGDGGGGCGGCGGCGCGG